MKSWIFLFVAITAEVIATSALKSSEGFTKPFASIVVILGYIIAFYCLSLTLKTIPVGIAYAIWSGVGIVLITTFAWFSMIKNWIYGNYRHSINYVWCVDSKPFIKI